MTSVSVRGSIRAHNEDSSRVLIYSQVTRKEAWMNVSDIEAKVFSNLSYNFYMNRQLAESLGLVNGET